MEEYRKLLEETVNVNTGRGRKPSTVRNYLYMLNGLSNQLTKNDIGHDNLSFLLNTSEVLDYLTVTHTPRNVRNYITAIMALLIVLDDDNYKSTLAEYQTGANIITEEIIKTSNLQEKTAAQLSNWTTLKSLQSVTAGYLKWLKTHGVFDRDYTDLLPSEKKRLRYWLISALYTSGIDNPPVRSNYAPMRIITDNKYKALTPETLLANNYLVIGKGNKKFFSFGVYKNVDHHGLKTIPVGKKLNLVLNKYLGVFISPPEYLLWTQNNTPMDSNGLSAVIPKVYESTGKHVTINLIRHIFISENISGDYISTKQPIADLMMHSISMQDSYRMK